MVFLRLVQKLCNSENTRRKDLKKGLCFVKNSKIEFHFANILMKIIRQPEVCNTIGREPVEVFIHEVDRYNP